MLRVLYAGSPEAAKITLEGLVRCSHENGFEIVGVLSNPPSAQGRHKTLVPTPVAEFAQANEIPVFTPEHLDAECREKVSEVKADILVCFAYGHIFGPKFLSLFKYGGMNLHPSALPLYRGCTPVNAAILNGDSSTAFTVQTVGLKMDEGNILAQKIVELNGTETAGGLLNDAALCGVDLISGLLKTVSETLSMPEGIVQEGEPSYTGIITKDMAKIDWNLPSSKIDCMVRAYSPEPCTWTLEKELPLKIISGFSMTEEEASQFSVSADCQSGTVQAFVKSKGILIRCGKGFFAVTKLQRQGKNPMDYKSFMNGVRDFIGSRLS